MKKFEGTGEESRDFMHQNLQAEQTGMSTVASRRIVEVLVMKHYQLRTILCLTLAAVTVLSASSSVYAQRSRSTAERRQHPGKGFWANQRASRSLQHARDYSHDLYRYSRDAAVVAPEVAKSESEHLGRNIELAKTEITTVRKEHQGNKEVIAALDTIDKHLAKATDTHKQLHDECCQDSPDGDVCASCCSDITKELDKAAAEHDALMRMLEGHVHTVAPKN